MPDDEQSPSDIFAALFGEEQPSDEEREAERHKWDDERNESSRLAFEKERERRADYIAMDQRIRNIASGEINKVVNALLLMGIGYAAWRGYGFIGAMGVALAGAGLVWLQSRAEKQRPQWMIAEIDDLAEDTVTQELIVEWERQGKPWIIVKGQYLHYEDFFAYPFWQTVQKRVRSYASKPHKIRIADNAAARKASLPFRLAMRARLKAHNVEWDLPSWSRLSSAEKAENDHG